MPKTKNLKTNTSDYASGTDRIEQIKSEIVSCSSSPTDYKAEVLEWNSIFETETEQN